MKYKMERGLEGPGQLSVRTCHELIPREEDPFLQGYWSGLQASGILISPSLPSLPPPSL